jgi:hypothetical protein
VIKRTYLGRFFFNEIWRCGMENEILKYVITQGVFAVLFVYLLFYVLKENSKRENNYQGLIGELTRKFNIIENVQDDVKDIKKHIFKN